MDAYFLDFGYGLHTKPSNCTLKCVQLLCQLYLNKTFKPGKKKEKKRKLSIVKMLKRKKVSKNKAESGSHTGSADSKLREYPGLICY